MLNYLRLYIRLVVFVTPVLLPLATKAQIFIGEPQQVAVPDAMKKVLTEYTVYRLDALALKQYANSSPENTSMQLMLGSHNWSLQLQPSKILAPNYVLQVSTDNGIETFKPTENLAFKGYEATGGGKVRLTFDEDFKLVIEEMGGCTYYHGASCEFSGELIHDAAGI